MKELSARVQIFNNRLRQRRLELSLSAPDFAAKVGISYQTYLRLETLKEEPFDLRNGEWREIATQLAKFYCVPEEELFPHSVLHLQKREVERRFDAEEAFSLMGDGHAMLALPEDTVSAKEASDAIEHALSTLTRREEQILRMRFGLGQSEHTLKEVAEEFGVTAPRIASIQGKALRKLRHPSGSLRRLVRRGGE